MEQHHSNLDSDLNIDIKKYLFIILANWYWFVLSLIISLTVVYFINKYKKTNYQATVTMLLEDKDNNNDVLMQLRSFRAMQKQQDLANEIAKLKSYRLARRTVDGLNMDVEYFAYGRIRERAMYNSSTIEVIYDSIETQPKEILLKVEILNASKYKLIGPENSKIDTTLKFNEWYSNNGFHFKILNSLSSYMSYGFIFHDKNSLANYFKSAINIEADEKKTGTLITISLTTDVAQKSVDYLKKLCEEYISFNLEYKNLMSENTIKFINEQLNTITDSLHIAEQKMLNFRIANGVVDISKQSNKIYEKVEGYNNQKTELVFKQKYYEYLLKLLKENKSPQLIILPSILNINEPVLNSLISELIKINTQKEETGIVANSENPALESINKRLNYTREKIIETLTTSISNNKFEQVQIDNEYSRTSNLMRDIPRSERDMLNIERTYDINNKFYNFLLERRAEAGIKKASNVSDVRILDEPMVENVSVISQKYTTILAMGILLGLLLPFVILFLIDFLNPRIRSKADIEHKTKIPILGVLGHDYSGSEIPVIQNPRSSFTEAFRMIRTNLQFIIRDKTQKVIMVTSTVSGEGKTFLTLNLAAVLSLTGKKVLLAGMDLRKPALHKMLLNSNEKGVSTYLIGKHSFEEIIYPLNISNLYFAPSGPIPPNPAEILETEQMKNFIDRATSEYDYVIIDTPPVGMVTDALIIGEHCHASIYVIRQNFSHKDSLNLINNLNAEKKFNNLNLIVNDIKISQSMGYRYYYGYGYGYGYGYNYGYGKKYQYAYEYHHNPKRTGFFGKIKDWLRSEE